MTRGGSWWYGPAAEFSPDDLPAAMPSSSPISSYRRMVEDVVSRPFWTPGRDTLFDHAALELNGQAFPVISKAADTHRQFDEAIGTGRAAIVMPNQTMFGVGRMFEEMTGGAISARLRIFRDEQQAREWLLE